MAKARGIPPLGRTPNALPAPQAPAYLPMAKARGITQDLGEAIVMQYGRKAYGSHRTMSPEVKARNVAESIVAHGYDVNDAATWQRYGIGANVAQQALVRQALAQR